MKKLKLICYYLLVIFMCGCVPSLHPLFTKEQAITDVNLFGIWIPKDSNEVWEFKPAEKGCEGIYVDDKGKTGKFNVVAGKLNGDLFLDILPIDSAMPENDFYKVHFVPGHTFLRAELNKVSLALRAMNPEAVDKLLKADPKAVKHERIEGGGIVLTASTQELQGSVIKYGLDEKNELFGEAKTATKQK